MCFVSLNAPGRTGHRVSFRCVSKVPPWCLHCDLTGIMVSQDHFPYKKQSYFILFQDISSLCIIANWSFIYIYIHIHMRICIYIYTLLHLLFLLSYYYYYHCHYYHYYYCYYIVMVAIIYKHWCILIRVLMWRYQVIVVKSRHIATLLRSWSTLMEAALRFDWCWVKPCDVSTISKLGLRENLNTGNHWFSH